MRWIEREPLTWGRLGKIIETMTQEQKERAVMFFQQLWTKTGPGQLTGYYQSEFIPLRKLIISNEFDQEICESGLDTQAYLILADAQKSYIFSNGKFLDKLVIGSLCFRWRKWSDHEPGWALQWVWLHPHFQRKGLLSEVWELLKVNHGLFMPEPPFSDAMYSFFEKHKVRECLTV